MTNAPSKMQILTARAAAIILVALIAIGLFEYIVAPRELKLLLQDLLARPGGRMTFRFILQPAMAIIAALRDGIKDGRAGRRPYLWAIISQPDKRTGRLYEGLISTARIILLGVVMDTVYQWIELKTFYPLQAVIVAILLAFIPYLVLRGPISRVVYWRRINAGKAVTKTPS